MEDFAIPSSLELEATRRNGIPALRREVVHNTTTQNEYRPGELCYIPIDSGSAGAFTDVSTTRLELTVVVRNKNYYTDFINLSRCGWHALIQEFGIEINNGLHELNRHYAECVELEMIRTGENRTPFEMTRSNPWKPAGGTAGKLHINFVKPSMVTAVGLPHCVHYPALTTLTSATTPDTLLNGMLLSTNPFIREAVGRKNNVAILIGSNDTPIHAKDLGWMVPSSFDLAQSYYDDRLPAQQEQLSVSKWQSGTLSGAAVPAKGYNELTETSAYPIGTTTGMDVNYTTNNRLIGLPHGGYLLSKYSKNTYSNVANIQTAVYGQSVGSTPPGNWPYKQPTDYHKLQSSFEASYRLVNSDNIMNYYANCKNIPVGIPTMIERDEGETTIWGSKIHTKTPIGSAGAETEFQISLKIYSSLIGVLAKKWFPELVVPQGRMRVRLRFQEPNVVFQTLMDPCRRVPGTSRDWFPNLGVTDTDVPDSVGGPYSIQIQDLPNLPPGKLTSGIHPIMVSQYNSGDVFTDSICLGKYVLPQMRSKQMHTVRNIFDTSRNYQTVWATSSNGDADLEYAVGVTDPTKVQLISIPDLPVSHTSQFQSYLTSLPQNAAGPLQVSTSKRLINLLAQHIYETRANQEYGYPVFPTRSPTQYPPVTPAGSSTLNAAVDWIEFDTIGSFSQYTWPNNWRTMQDKQGTVTQGSTTSLGNNGSTGTASYPDYQVGFTPKDTTQGGTVVSGQRYDANYDWEYKALNWNPFCFPTPQYLPMNRASDKSVTRNIALSDWTNEEGVCFGTHLESSVAQVRRSHSALYPLNVTDGNQTGLDERLTYVVRNVQIVTQQIILPRPAALSIVENALSGGISMETRAWKEMESMLPKQETQKHLINMAAAFCTNITFLFRPTEVFQGDRAFGYNSFSFYNPFTSFYFVPPTGVTEKSINALGGQPIYYNECIMQSRIGIDVQLQLASELMPRTPIDTVRRLLQHTRWGDQVFSERDYMELNPHLHPSYGTQKGIVINTLQDGFWACFTPISALDDQTITCNPFFTSAEISLRQRLRGVRCHIDALPIYKPYDGTFHLSFNFETFMGQNERIRTGVPIVNNNMFLKFDKAHMVRDFDTQLLTVAECDARVVFERGGTMQFFT